MLTIYELEARYRQLVVWWNVAVEVGEEGVVAVMLTLLRVVSSLFASTTPTPLSSTNSMQSAKLALISNWAGYTGSVPCTSLGPENAQPSG